MFCRKCGKYIPSSADVCADCAAKEARYTPVTPVANIPVQEGNLMNGFGKALTASILGFIGVFCSAFGCVFAILATAASVTGDMPVTEPLVYAIVFWVIAIGLAIPALLFGVRSIKLFIAEKKAGHKKPIPALALGIGAVVCAGCIALIALITLFYVAVLTSVPALPSDSSYGSNYY